jgi:hypothetical protein
MSVSKAISRHLSGNVRKPTSVPPIEKPKTDQQQDGADGAATMADAIPVPRWMLNWGSN